MKKVTRLFFSLALVVALTACAGRAATPNVSPSSTAAPGATAATVGLAAVTALPRATVGAQATPAAAVGQPTVKYETEDLAPASGQSDASYVKLNGTEIAVTGQGATVQGRTLTIMSAGTYQISGQLDDGQIVVDTKDAATVKLILSAVAITHSAGPAIYVANAEKTVITLAAGTENRVADGPSYALPAGTDEPDATIFSKDDLTINGEGSLTVQANYKHGIVSKDDLKITGGRITVVAVNDGLKGRDSLAIKDGTLTVRAGSDGLQATNAEDPKQGYVVIEGGTLNITATGDGIQAETRLTVSGGDLTLLTGGGSSKQVTDSAKGLKAGVDLTVTAGVVRVDAADDAFHSDGSITIGGGELELASGDDAVHAETALTVSGGAVRITRSYEGLESNQITINGGTIYVTASDDGINGPSTTGVGGGPMPGRPMGGFEVGDSRLAIRGGYIVVNATGDGIDINGTMEMSGGMVIVHGPTANNNAALDYLGTFNVTGGLLVAVGSAGMAQAPSPSSTQYSLVHTYATPQAGGTLVHIQTSDGKALLTFAPAKAYQSVVVSSPEIRNGATYVIYSGGRATGTAVDGLYAGGVYTPGTQVASYTVSGIVTGAGPGMGGFPGGRGGIRPPRP